MSSIPDCPICSATVIDHQVKRFDEGKMPPYLSGVKYLRTERLLNRTEWICMECGSDFYTPGISRDWENRETVADNIPIPERPESVEKSRATTPLERGMAEIREKWPELLERTA